ncbi:hypothetical protein [Cryptosporangium minutisporangium]|uniref:Uncharacterized protein n=1 Tax=Cryptosporangium minutisporangium TaxID=113569 RepID=A0ABP6SU86_9ACTN
MLRFLRHLVEMLLAMGVGMAVLGIGLMVVGEPPGYEGPLVTYGAMGVAMAVPMVAWMRYRGHSWSDGGQMTAAMLVPMFVLVIPVVLDVAPAWLAAEGTLMVLTHVAMVGGMVAYMLVRRDQYTQGHHRHSAPQPDSALG